MDTKISSIFFLSCCLILSSTAMGAFDITKLLEKESDLSKFNNYLKETKLAEEINKRQTITVLTVGNDAIGSLSGKSPEVIKKTLSTHVILDYYDEQKLTEVCKSNDSASLVTLFQASGQAQNQQGFIKVALINEGEIAFGSASKSGKNDDMNVKLVRTVTTQPHSISVLQVTAVIDVAGLGSGPSAAVPASSPNTSSSSAAPKSSSSSSAAPKSSSSSSAAPKSSSSSASPKGSPAPNSITDSSKAASPSDDGKSETDSPLSSPPTPENEAATPAVATPAAAPSAASRSGMAFGAVGVVVMGLVSLLVA